MAYFFSSLALIIAVLSFFYLRFFVVKRTSIERINEQILTETRETVRQMIDDIDRITDRDAQLIEQRVRELKTLLADADRRIGAFSRDVETRIRRDTAYAELGRKGRSAQAAAQPGTLFDSNDFDYEKTDDIKEKRDVIKKREEKSEKKTHTVKLQSGVKPEENLSVSESSPSSQLSKHEQIILLSASGKTPDQIAVQLNMSIAAVEMLLVRYTQL